MRSAAAIRTLGETAPLVARHIPAVAADTFGGSGKFT